LHIGIRSQLLPCISFPKKRDARAKTLGSFQAFRLRGNLSLSMPLAFQP